MIKTTFENAYVFRVTIALMWSGRYFSGTNAFTMDNPFEIIEQRLRSIEHFLQQIQTGSLQAASTQVAEVYLKIDQAAAFLSTTPNALRVMVCQNQIVHIKKHGRLYFRQSDLVDWLEGRNS